MAKAKTVVTKLVGNVKKKGVSKRKYNKHNPRPKSYRGQGR